jgi:hypothetical protein
MPDKTILLYDAKNAPLKVRGIQVELFDAISGTLLQAQTSDNLDPTSGPSSVEWGVILTFSTGTRPLDILITDPKYRYPGNTVRYLNGDLQDRVFIDLLALPAAVPTQTAPPRSSKPQDLVAWVDGHAQWNEEQRDAVLNLAFNYMRVVVAGKEKMSQSKELGEVARNWEEALERLGIPKKLFEEDKTRVPPTSSSTPIKRRTRYTEPPPLTAGR